MICLAYYGLNTIIMKQDEVLKNLKFSVGFFDDHGKINVKKLVC